jgi:hypothetical protein
MEVFYGAGSKRREALAAGGPAFVRHVRRDDSGTGVYGAKPVGGTYYSWVGDVAVSLYN